MNVSSVATQAPVRVFQKRWYGVLDLAWVPDGRGLVITTQEQWRGEPSQIAYVSHTNREVRRITSDLNFYPTSAQLPTPAL